MGAAMDGAIGLGGLDWRDVRREGVGARAVQRRADIRIPDTEAAEHLAWFSLAQQGEMSA